MNDPRMPPEESDRSSASGSQQIALQNASALHLARLVYYVLQVLHDFAYFGYMSVQPLILVELLEKFAGEDAPPPVTMTVVIIATHLLWQSVFETASGSYADSRGRLVAVRRGYFCRIAAVLLVLAVGTFSLMPDMANSRWAVLAAVGLLFAAQMLMAAGEALFTGSVEAWLVDTLQHNGHEQFCGEVFAAASVRQNAAILVAIPTFLVLHNQLTDGGTFFILSVSAVLFAVGALASLAATEEYAKSPKWRSRRSDNSNARVTRLEARRHIRNTRGLRATVAMVAAPFGLWVVISWLWPLIAKTSFPSLVDHDLVLPGIGVALGLSRVAGAYVAQLVEVTENPVKYLVLSTLMNVGTGLVLACGLPFVSDTGSGTTIAAALLILLLLMAKGTEEVVKVFAQVSLAKCIHDETLRATVISYAAKRANTMAFAMIVVASAGPYLFDMVTTTAWSLLLVTGVTALILVLVARMQLGRDGDRDESGH